MSLQNLPASLKSLRPYLVRAQELDNEAGNEEGRVVSYFCKSYVMDKAFKARSSLSASEQADVNKFLPSLMTQLEQEKAALGSSATYDQGKMICENFAFDIFTRADDEDRTGNGNKETAKKFYAASNFFTVLEQFGDLTTEFNEKLKYAKWKAGDITRALKEGRKPTAGSPGSEEESDSFLSKDEVPPGYSNTATDNYTNFSSGNDVVSFTAGNNSILPSISSSDKSQQPNDQYKGYSGTNSKLTSQSIDHLPSVYTQPFTAPSASLYNSEPKFTTQVPSGYQYPVDLTPSMTKQSYGSSSTSNTDPRMKDAMELCDFAKASLKEGNISLARERLQEALRRLG